QISDLRDQVSNPTRIDQLLREIAGDPQAQVAIREEAKDLQVVPANGPRSPQSPLSPQWTKWTAWTLWTPVSAPSEARAKALLESVANADENDLELLSAVGAIKLHH